MANLLCIYENRIATVEILEEFFSRLNETDQRVQVKFVSVLNLIETDLSWCDVLYMIRPNNAVFARLAEMTKKYGIVTVTHLDDDLLHLPQGNIDIPWRKRGLEMTIKNSDILSSPSPYICKTYANSFEIKRTISVDTPVPECDIKTHLDEKNGRTKIVYAAGIAHNLFFDLFVHPILDELNGKYGDKISMTFMGVRPEIDVKKYSFPIDYIDSLPFKEYRERVGRENFDIGLAPLSSTEFTRCKYFNKFIEYSIFGIVGIYSDTEPYTFVVKNNENGILAGDDPLDWLEAICRLIDDKQLIKRCRDQAYSTLRTRFNSEEIMNRFINDLPEIVNYHKEKSVKAHNIVLYKAIYRLSRIEDWIFKAYCYYKMGGLHEVSKGLKRRLHSKQVEKLAK